MKDDLFSRFVRESPDAVLVVRLVDGCIVEANQPFLGMTGYERQEVIGRSTLDIGLWESAEMRNRLVERLRETGTAAGVTFNLKTNDGDPKVVETSAQLIEIEGETCILALGRDVTNRRQTEEAVRSAEAKYRTLVEQIPAITYIDAVDGPATTLYISPQTEAILGFTQQEWFDDPELLSKRIHPEDHDRWRAEVERCDKTGSPFRLEYRILGRDGRVVWVHDESTMLRDESGKPLFWQGVMFDITERKDAEEKLEQAWQREMEAGHRLRALDEMKNTFLEAVSHELRTPLTTILGSALTLEREDVELDRQEIRDLVRRMAANARKLNALLSDLLDLDRLARGIVEPKRQPTDVAALARGVVEETEQAEERPVELDVEPVEVWVDPAKVERIVENLVVNAFRHTPAGTRVWVRVRPSSGGALISVEDSGQGIPESERQAIFEPFRQLPSGQAHSPGVGIGLSLVARFAEIHGGRAWVEDRPGGGASFKVYLPGRSTETILSPEPATSGSRN